MARNQEEVTTEVATEAGGESTTGAAPAAAKTGGDERYSMIVLDEQAANLYGVEGAVAGSTVKRKDFIVQLWSQKRMKRGDIKNEVNRLAAIEGNPTKEIAYQIVFQATKGVEGGPVEASAPATPAA